jgi:hypothetical protein
MPRHAPTISYLLASETMRSLNPHLIEHATPANAPKQARERRSEPNDSEATYFAIFLERLQHAGATVLFESERLLLPGGIVYRPDFIVEWPDGSKEYHEVKGGSPYAKRTGRNPWKVAAAMVAGTWFYAQKTEDGWKIEVRICE